VSRHQEKPELFLSLPFECSYLDGRLASTLFIDPNNPRTPDHYNALLEKGFRRSGKLIYRPHCGQCTECISVRIPVNRFRPSRSQKRILKRNQDLRLVETPPRFDEKHFSLYRQYQKARHTNGSMDNDDRQAYEDFLVDTPVDNRFLEFRDDRDTLLAVAVTDFTDSGLSAVYTFFDPDQPRRGLGVFAILHQVALAKAYGLDYLYLGYWIKDCDKMSYKQNYRPLQGFIGNNWRMIKP
jgi:arginyl-tRNA--protein-N-Asp/Glu arginylyltransferase